MLFKWFATIIFQVKRCLKVSSSFYWYLVFEPGPDTRGWKFVTPNLTFDPETGVMARWSEEEFIKRFRMGHSNPDSPMPWGTFSKLEESDLKALYRFLKSVEPVNNPESGQSIPPAQAANL